MNHQLNICKNQLHYISVPCILTDAIFHLPNDPEDLEIIKNRSWGSNLVFLFSFMKEESYPPLRYDILKQSSSGLMMGLLPGETESAPQQDSVPRFIYSLHWILRTRGFTGNRQGISENVNQCALMGIVGLVWRKLYHVETVMENEWGGQSRFRGLLVPRLFSGLTEIRQKS